MPKMQQGICTYSYRLFHLEDGEEITDLESSVQFDINFVSPAHHFDPAEITAFMREANGLIGDSTLLVNTNHWMLNLEDVGNGRLRDNILISLNYGGTHGFETEDELYAALIAYEEKNSVAFNTNSYPPISTDILQADLDHDGTLESLRWREDEEWTLEVYPLNSDIPIWEYEVLTAHVGWEALFLYQLEGEDYLLRYRPYMSVGLCGYSYQVFYLTAGKRWYKKILWSLTSFSLRIL